MQVLAVARLSLLQYNDKLSYSVMRILLPLSQQIPKYRLQIALASGFAVLGLLVSLISNASSPTLNVQAEVGTESANAKIVADGSADEGYAIRFGSNPVSGDHTKIVGINDHPIWLRASQDTLWSYLRNLGVKSVRIDLPWDVIQTAPHTWDSVRVALIDDYLNRASAAGIDVDAVLTDSPSWGNGGSADRHAAPDPNMYADYVQDVLTRWPGKIKAIEIWNEPNGGWAWVNPNAIQYANLLKVAYTRAKAVDPSVLVVAPNISGPDQTSWTSTFYNQPNISQYFDIFGAHGYWFNISGSTLVPYYNSANPNQSIFGAFVTRILPIMQSHGDGNKRIWWGETGVATQGNISNETDQANMVDDALAQFKAGRIPNMDRLYWYMLQDGVGTGSEQNYGVLDIAGSTPTQPVPSDFVPKPAYNRLKAGAATF